jgi:hypothetical protein
MVLPAANSVAAIMHYAYDRSSERVYQEAVRKILSAERHWTIIKSFAAGCWKFGDWKVHPMIPLTAFIAFAGVDFRMLRRRHWLACCLIIVLSGYYLVYLTTSWTLLDHINSSLVRLLIQLWPALLFTLGLAKIRVETDRSRSVTQIQG